MMYSYNGVELPERPDTGVNPYHYIIQYSGVEGWEDGYLLLASGVEFSCTSNGIAYPGTVQCLAWNCTDGKTWANGGTYSISYPLGELGTVIWTLTDILYEGSTVVYMEGSEPVPSVSKWANMRSLVRGIMAGLVSKGYLTESTGDTPVNPDEPITPIGYLAFSSNDPFTITSRNATKSWDGILYYSTDNELWYEWDASVIASASKNGKQQLYLRGTGNSVISQNVSWVLDGNNIRCDGNIENLLDYETVAIGEHPVMGEKCYASLFAQNSSLVSAPELPATTLTNKCYSGMFFETSLVVAPKLPATTLAQACYETMFRYCYKLTTAPELPATVLASNCYRFMFGECTSLTIIPRLPATKLEESCYYFMFYGCTKVKVSTTLTPEYPVLYRIPTDGTGTTATNALSNMFSATGGTFTGTPNINQRYYIANKAAQGG